MATDLSQFPVPNNRFDVAQDNAAKLDSIVNGPDAVVTTRTGKGIQSIDKAIASIAAVVDRGTWTTATSYQVKDLVLDTGIYYIAVTAHTSGATFAGDIANWRVYQGVTQNQLGFLAVHSFNDLATAKAATDISIGDTVFIRFRTSANDGGDAKYLVEALGSPDGFGDHATTGIAGAQLTLQQFSVLNVKQFGAVEDGVTDDSAPIQAAIDHVESPFSAIILFNSSDYYIGSGINVETTGIGNKGITLRGVNPSTFGVAPAINGTRIITDQPIDMLNIGSATVTLWIGPVIEDITFKDTSASGNQVTSAIHIKRTNMGYIRNVDFQRIKVGAGIKTTGASGNPQYWTVTNCRWHEVKFGIQQTTTSADWNIIGGIYWGVTADDPIIAGSIGFDIQGTCKLTSVAIQYAETLVKLTNAPASKLMGCTLENSSAQPGLIGIDVVSGDGVQIIGTDIINGFSTARIRVGAGVSRTTIISPDDNGAAGAIIDNGTDTMILDPQSGRDSKIPGDLTIGGQLTLSNATTNLISGVKIVVSGANPEGAITAPVGSLHLRTTGGAGFTLAVKESGAGNTGWVNK